MFKRKVLSGLTLVVASAVIVTLLLFSGGTLANAHPFAGVTPTPVPSEPAPIETEPVLPPSAGVPAVTHPGGGLITPDDVKAFVTKYGFPGGKTVSGTPLTILQITLMTALQAKALLHGESTDRPDAAMVFYVQLAGPFILSNMSFPPGVKPFTVQKVEMVFDSVTGNLLLMGSSG